MDDMSRKISEILNNPEAMEQIRGLTGLLGGNTAPSDPTASDEQGRTAPSGGSVSDTGLAGMQNVSNLCFSPWGQRMTVPVCSVQSSRF